MKEEKKGKNKKQEYEFCEVCRLNHNQGHRHKYFSSHKSAVSVLLTRFQSKLADVRFFLKYPMALCPENAQQTGFWCLFCNHDVLERARDFSCGNVIEHLASGGHWKKVKEFKWKHGLGMDGAEVFRIAEVDFEKWEKKRNSIMNGSFKRDTAGTFVGPLNNIHNELNADFTTNFHEANVKPLVFNISKSVVPLQIYTNEKAQVSCVPVSSSISEVASLVHCVPDGEQIGDDRFPKLAAGGFNNHLHANSHGSSFSNGSVNYQGNISNRDGGASGLQNLAQISRPFEENTEGNIHTGAPPPWFGVIDMNHQHDGLPKPVKCDFVTSKPGKSSKLNPKRVGAAWAERKKLEMELEKRGEVVTDNLDSSWLPNFGRVWQSGTRKDSRKEFLMEAKGLIHSDHEPGSSLPSKPYISKRKVDEASESTLCVQPYVSKRKRMDG